MQSPRQGFTAPTRGRSTGEISVHCSHHTGRTSLTTLGRTRVLGTGPGCAKCPWTTRLGYPSLSTDLRHRQSDELKKRQRGKRSDPHPRQPIGHRQRPSRLQHTKHTVSDALVDRTRSEGHLKALVYVTSVDDMCNLRNRIVAGCEIIRNFPGIHQRIHATAAPTVIGVVSYGEESCIMQTNAAMAFHSNMIQPAGHTLYPEAQPVGNVCQHAVANQTQGPFKERPEANQEWVRPHQRDRRVFRRYGCRACKRGEGRRNTDAVVERLTRSEALEVVKTDYPTSKFGSHAGGRKRAEDILGTCACVSSYGIALQPFVNFTYFHNDGTSQQDNAPCHRPKMSRISSGSILESFDDCCLLSPPHSPDMNPIKHLWNLAGMSIPTQDPASTNSMELWLAIKIIILWDVPFIPPLQSGATPYSPHFALISSEDLDVKSRPNLFTPLEKDLHDTKPLAHDFWHVKPPGVRVMNVEEYNVMSRISRTVVSGNGDANRTDVPTWRKRNASYAARSSCTCQQDDLSLASNMLERRSPITNQRLVTCPLAGPPAKRVQHVSRRSNQGLLRDPHAANQTMGTSSSKEPAYYLVSVYFSTLSPTLHSECDLDSKNTSPFPGTEGTKGQTHRRPRTSVTSCYVGTRPTSSCRPSPVRPEKLVRDHNILCDKIDVKHVCTGVTFGIGSQFVRHALDDSEPTPDYSKKISSEPHTARCETRHHSDIKPLKTRHRGDIQPWQARHRGDIQPLKTRHQGNIQPWQAWHRVDIQPWQARHSGDIQPSQNRHCGLFRFSQGTPRYATGCNYKNLRKLKTVRANSRD
ncbi:hypothetical protein PR048_014171 [Dryococelus australis]|uniref:Uncharacterized protein n=1 Tax=Dryococelus australis TaxID=614101 RepID=A0ABQ9HDP7_9NEOP|nr:hypothetical protein PR048_014171 [Dryococelus australis]